MTAFVRRPIATTTTSTTQGATHVAEKTVICDSIAQFANAGQLCAGGGQGRRLVRHRDRELLTPGDRGQMSSMRTIDERWSVAVLAVVSSPAGQTNVARVGSGRRRRGSAITSLTSTDRRPFIGPGVLRTKTTDGRRESGGRRTGRGAPSSSFSASIRPSVRRFKHTRASAVISGRRSTAAARPYASARIDYDVLPGRRVLNEPASLGFRRRASRTAAREPWVSMGRGGADAIGSSWSTGGDCSRVAPARARRPIRVIARVR